MGISQHERCPPNLESTPNEVRAAHGFTIFQEWELLKYNGSNLAGHTTHWLVGGENHDG